MLCTALGAGTRCIRCFGGVKLCLCVWAEPLHVHSTRLSTAWAKRLCLCCSVPHAPRAPSAPQHPHTVCLPLFHQPPRCWARRSMTNPVTCGPSASSCTSCKSPGPSPSQRVPGAPPEPGHHALTLPPRSMQAVWVPPLLLQPRPRHLPRHEEADPHGPVRVSQPRVVGSVGGR